MNFYTQTLIELVLALGAAMAIGNAMAIVRRNRDRNLAREALKTSTRASRQTTKVLAKEQVKRGTATLAVAPLWRSVVFVVIGVFVAFAALGALIR